VRPPEENQKKKGKENKTPPTEASLLLETVPEDKRVLSETLHAAVVHFFQHHPSDRFRANLRRMLLHYLMYDESCTSVYLYETLLDLDGFFELLDVAAKEWKDS
jgi:hypothetical protein